MASIFVDNIKGFLRIFLITGEMKLAPLEERLIISAIFQLPVSVLHDHMNIHM